MSREPGLILSPFSPGFNNELILAGRRVCQNPQCNNPGRSKCAKCNTAKYCSRECQVAHWNTHKRICLHPSADSRFVGDVPRAWNDENRTLAEGSTPETARLIYDETNVSSRQEYQLEILSIGSRATITGYYGFEVAGIGPSYTICISGGSGTFISQVRRLHPLLHVRPLTIGFHRFVSPGKET